jgi:hypothetical protein
MADQTSYDKTSSIFASIFDFPPVNWTRDLLHTTHLAGVEQDPNMICSFPQSRHFTLRKRERGFGISSFSGKRICSSTAEMKNASTYF